MNNLRFEVDELICVIGDNEGEGVHRPGYNGVFSLSTSLMEENLFVPEFSGLNLELIFDGSVWSRELLFEPRRSPMALKKINDSKALLHQPATPFWGLESWTWFTLVPPHYMDITFKCVPRRDRFRFGWIGLLWATYVNKPADKSIYFLGFPPAPRRRDKPMWLQHCTQYHGRDSTVRHVSDDVNLELTEDHQEFLFPSVSPLKYVEPFYYGRFRENVYMIMFDKPGNIRFSHSPSGGGYCSKVNDTCPAWDFQYIIPRYRLNEEYGFSARIVYKRFNDRNDLLTEYGEWKAQQ